MHKNNTTKQYIIKESNIMKKNNKGFSLVELIIVIAIMAILAGALAPALIKYINKSRKSADESNADVIRTSIQTALSNEEAVDSFCASNTSGIATSKTVSDLKGMGAFGDELKKILGNNQVKAKYYTTKGQEFMVDINYNDNKVIVYSPDGNTVIVGN